MAGRAVAVMLVAALCAGPVLAGDLADDLARAEQLAWDRKFAESEELYRAVVARDPSRRAALGLARVILWSGRYDEATAAFEALLRVRGNDADALEGRGLAAYWSGDHRSAARDFRRVLELDPERETARTSLAGIRSGMRPSQTVRVGGSRDDQPLDVNHAEVAATFFSDPLTRWTVAAGAVHRDAGRRGTETAESIRIETDTRWRGMKFSASAGAFDGGLVGHASATRGSLTLRVDRREELASATAIRADAFSTTTALRWGREDERLIAAAEISDRRYSDDNSGQALVAYAITPILKRGGWTVWAGASAAARDTRESRFRMTAVSSLFDAGVFRYAYRGEYDPYWTPDNLVEGRAVVAVEREVSRGRFKIHADGGRARDRGRAFGPDAGRAPFPPEVYSFTFDRDSNPWRFGASAGVTLSPSLRLDIGVERSVTVDYRSTSFHAAVARRR